MDIGEARKAMKDGRKVARAGWNGKDMWVAYSPGCKDLLYDNFWSPAVKSWVLDYGTLGRADVLPCFLMKTVDGKILIGWLASQTDLDAEDWFIVD